MFKEMRRKDRALSQEVTKEILMNGEYGVISSCGSDGYAYGVPVNYAFTENSIYFHCFIKNGHKLDNFNNNNKVSFCVVGETKVKPEEFTTEYESVIAFGKISEVYDDEKTNALKELLNKYCKDFLETGMKYITADLHKTGVYKIEIEHLTGKSNK